jgi:hypothetical protein
MAPVHTRKARICQALLERNQRRRLEGLACDERAPVGHEFGSPDFDRLIEHDNHTRAGVFDPTLKEFFVEVDLNKQHPVRRRMKK